MTMVINVVLIILFCYIALISYYSDKKNGIIPNKNLLVIGIIAVILKILDYKNIDIMIIQFVHYYFIYYIYGLVVILSYL